jgi:hypothetical protein
MSTVSFTGTAEGLRACPYDEAATIRPAQPPDCTRFSLQLLPARNLLSHRQARIGKALQAWRTSLLRFASKSGRWLSTVVAGQGQS